MSSPNDDISGSPEAGRLQLMAKYRRSPKNEVSVLLYDPDTWQAFDSLTNEMIINKNGRRMFPHLAVSLQGLEPMDVYSVWMHIIPVSDYRYKWENERWVATDKALPAVRNIPYQHSASPNFGHFWIDREVSFASVELTNSKTSKNGDFLLHPKHKYMVQILVKSARSDHTFPLPSTRFIAVTAHQNKAVAELKIRLNPRSRALHEEANKMLRKWKCSKTRNDKKCSAESKKKVEKKTISTRSRTASRESAGRPKPSLPQARPRKSSSPPPSPDKPKSCQGPDSQTHAGQAPSSLPSTWYSEYMDYMNYMNAFSLPWMPSVFLNPAFALQMAAMTPLMMQHTMFTPPWPSLAFMGHMAAALPGHPSAQTGEATPNNIRSEAEGKRPAA